MTTKLSKEKITEIVDASEDMYEALVRLYQEAIQVEWEKIESIKPWGVQVNRTTGKFIISEFHRKFTKDNDEWPVNGLLLNKGLSFDHPELKDWEVNLTNDCFTLKP
jgi:hypothetical protein